MFGIKKETDYAIQLLNYLARKKGKYSSLKQFSKESKISFWFLQKIARKLTCANLVEAEQGINGGYKLKVPAKSLNLRKVMEAMEGKIGITECLRVGAGCTAGKNCFLRNVSTKLNKEIVKILQDVKISA